MGTGGATMLRAMPSADALATGLGEGAETGVGTGVETGTGGGLVPARCAPA